MKRMLFLLVVPIAAVTLTACGDDSGRPATGHSMRGHMSSAPAAGHNAQDVMFAQMMIPHHQQAIVMAKDAATKASSPKVKKLAKQIEQAQNPEIQKMTGWLTSWGEPTSSHGDMHMSDGMMSDKDMKRLGRLSGTAFDRLFLRMMIVHHKGAITMAKSEQRQGSFPEATALAGSIVTSQSAEVATMRKLLAAK